MSFQFRLVHGEDGLTYSSFLQKFVRAGQKEEAYYVAKLYLPKNTKYLVKRIKQFLPEEIGRANLDIYPIVMRLCQKLTATQDEDIQQMIVRQLLVLLCDSPKNKWTDLTWIYFKFNPEMKTYPLKPIDQCVTLEDYLAVFMAKFESVKETSALIRQLGMERQNRLLIDIAGALLENAQSKACKGLGCWICLAAQIAVSNESYPPDVFQTYAVLPDKIRDISKHPQIPDYFYDQHTKRGRDAFRGQLHWFHYCCRVNNYLRLPDDFKYDPLESGYNSQGVTEPEGMIREYLEFIEGGK